MKLSHSSANHTCSHIVSATECLLQKEKELVCDIFDTVAQWERKYRALYLKKEKHLSKNSYTAPKSSQSQHWKVILWQNLINRKKQITNTNNSTQFQQKHFLEVLK